MATLSTRGIDAQKPDPTKDRRIADGQGLYLKVARNGTKTFVFRYTYAGRSRQELTLGTYPELSLAAARERRMAQSRLLENGKNPIQEKSVARTAKLTASTVDELIELFYENNMKKHRLLPKPDYDTLKRHISKDLGHLLVEDVTRQDITTALNKVGRSGKVIQNRVLALTRQLFAYAIDQHHREDTPVSMTRKAAGGKEKPRTTNLSFDQVTKVMEVLYDPLNGLEWQTRDCLLLGLATAKRPGELVTIEWHHIDLDKGEWVNPKRLTKEQRDDHLVYLNEYAVQLLRRIRQRNDNKTYVFPSPTKSKQCLTRHTLSRAILRLYNAGTLPYKFTPHDFRRTFSSRMADLGEMPHVVEKALDHLMVGVMAVYNLGSYYPERKKAMDVWGKKLEAIEPLISRP